MDVGDRNIIRLLLLYRADFPITPSNLTRKPVCFSHSAMVAKIFLLFATSRAFSIERSNSLETISLAANAFFVVSRLNVICSVLPNAYFLI